LSLAQLAVMEATARQTVSDFWPKADAGYWGNVPETTERHQTQRVGQLISKLVKLSQLTNFLNIF